MSSQIPNQLFLRKKRKLLLCNIFVNGVVGDSGSETIFLMGDLNPHKQYPHYKLQSGNREASSPLPPITIILCWLRPLCWFFNSFEEENKIHFVHFSVTRPPLGATFMTCTKNSLHHHVRLQERTMFCYVQLAL